MQKFNDFSSLKGLFPQERKEEKKVVKSTQRVRYFIDPRTGQLTKQVY